MAWRIPDSKAADIWSDPDPIKLYGSGSGSSHIGRGNFFGKSAARALVGAEVGAMPTVLQTLLISNHTNSYTA